MLTRDLLDDRHCQGVTFSVADADALARAIALVLMQEYALARSILSGDAVADDGDAIALDMDEIDDIVSRRLRPPVAYHRDGFEHVLVSLTQTVGLHTLFVELGLHPRHEPFHDGLTVLLVGGEPLSRREARLLAVGVDAIDLAQLVEDVTTLPGEVDYLIDDASSRVREAVGRIHGVTRWQIS